jgi:hypothetical protein
MNRIKPIIVNPKEDYILEIEFSNKEIKYFDCKPYINGDWFSELKDEKYFKTVRISGKTIEWKNGQDICPDCLIDNSFYL